MPEFEWSPEARGIVYDVTGGYGMESILEHLAPFVQHELAMAWGEGHDAGHRDARAVNPEWPELTRNPYRSDS